LSANLSNPGVSFIQAGFTLPSFGTFRIAKTKAREALNPRTGEPAKVKAGETVRFKASPNLKKAV